MTSEKVLRTLVEHLSPKEREGLQNLISLALVFLAFLYVTMFLGDLYVFAREQISRNFPEVKYFDFILKYGVILIVPTLYARAFLFAQDTLAHGRDRYARFFRDSLPSRFLAERLGCKRSEATELWFALFNAWRARDHARHGQWVATFRRTYSCRFIYYLQRWLLRAVILFSATLGIDQVYRYVWKGSLEIDDLLLLKALIVVCTVYGYFHISRVNRIGNSPSGCWSRLVEIHDMHKAWLEEEVVKPSDGDFGRAWELVKGMSSKNN